MTGYFSHRDCGLHAMGQSHPECPERLDAIHDRLLVTGLLPLLDNREAPEAGLADIELAHDRNYIASLRGLSARLADDVAAGGPALLQLDPDTAMNLHTWKASLRACGAVLAATDAVLAGEMENAFCAVRPPGHHACRDQAMGFCFINNIAVAAQYALQRHGLKRVAVVDFDVHHGNGTENILAGDDRVLMLGFFQHPFYPYSDVSHAAANMHNTPVPAYTRGDTIRELVDQLWLPQLQAFAPELVFISAGFDAHRDDDMGQMGLVEADYAFITQRVQKVARQCAKGRIVSSLEGGYDLRALACSVEAHIRVLADL